MFTVSDFLHRHYLVPQLPIRRPGRQLHTNFERLLLRTQLSTHSLTVQPPLHTLFTCSTALLRYPGDANMNRVAKMRSSNALTAREHITNPAWSRQANQFPRGQPYSPSQTSSGTTTLLNDHLHRPQSQHDPKDAMVMNSWLSEWATAPHDPLPSYPDPLLLLTEPTAINMKAHARNAKKVFLCHFYEHMIPEGRAQQETRSRKAEERKAKKRSLQDACTETAAEAEKEDGRKRVRRAVRQADVIDLTEDDAFQKKAPQPAPFQFVPQPQTTRSALSNLQQIRYASARYHPLAQATPLKAHSSLRSLAPGTLQY
jgi:hypothetical protein